LREGRNETHRARLRVELGRLRAALGQLAQVLATKSGFAPVRCASACRVDGLRDRVREAFLPLAGAFD
jgi:hypothetical protein